MGSCSQCEPVTMTDCINGVVELCPAGFFCPNVTATVPVACPDGFICKDGYISPVECDALSSCPAEAATKGPGAGLIGILFLMIFMTFAVLWLIALFRKRWSQTAVSAAAQRQQVSALMFFYLWYTDCQELETLCDLKIEFSIPEQTSLDPIRFARSLIDRLLIYHTMIPEIFLHV